MVVYYTLTGNSKFAAETIAAELGADTEEVIDLKNRQGRLSFLPNARAARSGKGTMIAPSKRTPTDYELVIIAQPIWGGSPTPAITTYLSKNDLAGKKVGLFFSDSQIWLDQAVKKTKALIPSSTFVGELALPAKSFENKGETNKKITEWCNTLKMA